MMRHFFIAAVSLLFFLQGCSGTMKQYQIGRIEISLPETFVAAENRKSSIPSPIPDGPTTTEHFFSFENKQGDKLTLFYWEGYPYRDYGPMSEKRSFPFSVAGQDTKIIQTEMFMGITQEVLVAHRMIPPNDRFMIFSTALDLGQFKSLLSTIRIH